MNAKSLLSAACCALLFATTPSQADEKAVAPVKLEQQKQVAPWTSAELKKLKNGLKLTWQHDTGVSVEGKPLTKTQILEITAIEGETMQWQVTREILSVGTQGVQRQTHVLKSEGAASEFVEEAVLRALPLTSECKVSDATLQVLGKDQKCSKVSFTGKNEDGIEVAETWWFLKDKPGVCARYERATGGKTGETLTLSKLEE
ncbi:MAG: hypothetical protein IPP14_08575 [Planctomycetes bacterium]|nr:hypothetical protein [Planctomycetota bacterium]